MVAAAGKMAWEYGGEEGEKEVEHERKVLEMDGFIEYDAVEGGGTEGELAARRPSIPRFRQLIRPSAA
jgi:hypothetical protein